MSINHEKNYVLAKWYLQSKISKNFQALCKEIGSLEAAPRFPCQEPRDKPSVKEHQMTLQTPCLLHSSKTQRLMPFLDQKTTATCLRFIMDNHSFKYKTAFYNQMDPDGQLSQSQIYTQDTDFDGKMQPRQHKKQLREQEVPVTIMSSTTLPLSTELHMRSGTADAGVGRTQEPDAKAQGTWGVGRGQQKTGATVGGHLLYQQHSHFLSLPC